MPLAPLTAEQANAIYDVLVRHAGAADWMVDDFVADQTEGACREYRFGGALGFGGKFRRNPGTDGTERWYVDTYPETTQAQPQLHEVINRTNSALAALRASYPEVA